MESMESMWLEEIDKEKRKQRMLAKDRRTQERIDNEVQTRIRQQQNATAIATGERIADRPSLIYANITGKGRNKIPQSHKIPQSQDVADTRPMETDNDTPMEPRYRNRMYADTESSRMDRQDAAGNNSQWNRIGNPQPFHTSVRGPLPCVAKVHRISSTQDSIYDPPPCAAYHHHARGRR